MGPENFVPALLALKDSDPSEVIARLHRIFALIGNMNTSQIIAAFQTVDTVAEVMGASRDRMVLRLKEAFRVQMIAIHPFTGQRVFGAVLQGRDINKSFLL